MSKIYYRPIISNQSVDSDGVYKLADGWAHFSTVEVLSRERIIEIMPAKDLPISVLRTLTKKRPDLLNLSFSKPHIMGILNMTPDSFSDGGQLINEKVALKKAFGMIDCGVSLLDIGGESTRPGAENIKISEEKNRVLPIIKAIRYAKITTPISVDTRKSEVFSSSLDVGSDILNDVSSMVFDEHLKNIVKKKQTPVCVMHSKGTPKNMKDYSKYDNVLLDVYDYLENIVDKYTKIGIPKSNIIIDPGIGFAKVLKQNLIILKGLSIFHGIGCPILLGASRKKFIGTIGMEENPLNLNAGSITVGLEALNQGVQILRVHDVSQTMQALRLWKSLRMEIDHE